MDVSRLLNHSDDEGPVPYLRPTEKFRRFASISSTSSDHRQNSFQSLSPLEHALPQLSASASDDSDSVLSPLTPDYTPETTPSLSSERDLKRHLASWPRPHALLSTNTSASSSRSHSYLSSRISDSLPMSAPDYGDRANSSSYLAYQNIQPSPLAPQLSQGSSLPVTPLDQSQPQPHAASSQKARPRKNSYPCPLAKQYNCSEHFTTSGHAARHAKKHTGKKDAVCPECLKAFTRKDNMEQHRRTHAPGRANAKPSASTDESKQNRTKMKLAHQAQQQVKRPKQPQTPLLETPIMPDMAFQGMPAGVISPQPNPPAIDTMGGMSALDPLLRSPPIQSSFDTSVAASMAYWNVTRPGYTPNQSLNGSIVGAPNERPRLNRSGFADLLQSQLQPAAHLRSPSATSNSSSADEQRSSTSSHRLEDLALAASQAPRP